LERDGNLWRTSWLPDGRRFVFYEVVAGSANRDLGLATVGAPDSTRMLFPSPNYSEDWPAVSPDGRWVAYVSNESGVSEVYVRPLEGMGTRRQVSRQGGDSPAWARSGRELFFTSGDSLYTAALAIGDDIQVRSVQPLFELPCCSEVGFAVFPDDSTFVGFEFESEGAEPDEQPVVIVHNFLSELQARLTDGS
jgi:Tol biopolymer transport system component